MHGVRLGLLAATLPVLVGCALELLTTTAIEGELQAQQAKTAVKQIDYAQNSSSKMSIQQAVNAYSAENGRYPTSLEELVPEYLPSLPTRRDGAPFGYDPATGAVLDKAPAQPTSQGPTQGDIQKMNQLARAIDRYGRTTGYYPGSLAELVPNCLAAIPRTDGAREFIYDPQTGYVYHPSQFNTQTQPAQAMGTTPGASGPMGEALTGIGIQNQLNSMSNAATNAAGSRARQGVNETAQTRDQYQDNVMNGLGL